MKITRKNVDKLLDDGKIFVALNNGRWWRIRRNGATKLWKRDASRIRIPFKYGLYGYGAIDGGYFRHDDGTLMADYFRHENDVPKGKAA